jgi:uncharacterized RDD family membrane protein YckC
MRRERAVAVRRVLAFAIDWLVVVLWGGVVFAAVMIATSGNPPRPENPWSGQVIGLIAMTVPVTLYFALCESSAMRASLGKRMVGLVVTRETGGRLLFGAALLRNGVKFVPWEFGHTVAQQAAFSGEAGFRCGGLRPSPWSVPYGGSSPWSRQGGRRMIVGPWRGSRHRLSRRTNFLSGGSESDIARCRRPICLCCGRGLTSRHTPAAVPFHLHSW